MLLRTWVGYEGRRFEGGGDGSAYKGVDGKEGVRQHCGRGEMKK